MSRVRPARSLARRGESSEYGESGSSRDLDRVRRDAGEGEPAGGGGRPPRCAFASALWSGRLPREGDGADAVPPAEPPSWCRGGNRPVATFSAVNAMLQSSFGSSGGVVVGCVGCFAGGGRRVPQSMQKAWCGCIDEQHSRQMSVLSRVSPLSRLSVSPPPLPPSRTSEGAEPERWS